MSTATPTLNKNKKFKSSMIKYDVKINYSNNWKPREISYNDINNYDFSKGFLECHKDLEFVHLYFDFDNISSEAEYKDIINYLDTLKVVFGDYSIGEEYVEGKTFIYFDPPYRPLIENSSFVGYDKSGFNDDNQKELAEFVKKLDKRNCLVMLSNSDPKNTNLDDNFFDELYKEFEIDRIFAKRMINCQADKRGDITEIVVRNYKRRK